MLYQRLSIFNTRRIEKLVNIDCPINHNPYFWSHFLISPILNWREIVSKGRTAKLHHSQLLFLNLQYTKKIIKTITIYRKKIQDTWIEYMNQTWIYFFIFNKHHGNNILNTITPQKWCAIRAMGKTECSSLLMFFYKDQEKSKRETARMDFTSPQTFLRWCEDIFSLVWGVSALNRRF